MRTSNLIPWSYVRAVPQKGHRNKERKLGRLLGDRDGTGLWWKWAASKLETKDQRAPLASFCYLWPRPLPSPPTSGNRLGASQRRGLWRRSSSRERKDTLGGWSCPCGGDHPRRCPSKAGMPLRQGAQASSVRGSGFRQLSSFPSRLVGGTTALAVCSAPQALPRCLQSWEKERLLLVNEPAEAGECSATCF